jgi:Skp family chaperone for outer membrane proteins
MFTQTQTQTRTRRFAFGLVAITAMCIVVGYAAVATTTHLRPPTVVVTFNIQRVTDDLLERADAQADLRKLESRIISEGSARFEIIEQLRASLETAAEQDRGQIIEQLERLNLKAMSFKRFAELQFDSERSVMFRDIYMKIKASVAVIAEENGYDLVLISDDDREISTNRESNIQQELQVLQQIKLQRVVFATNQIDITEQIVTYMNLEWEKRSD